jgi:hypothetical protein
MADVIKSTGKQLKLDNDYINRLRLNAWDDKAENKPYLHVEGSKELPIGLAAFYNGYSKPVDANNMSDIFQEGGIRHGIGNGMTVSAMMDKYGDNPSRHGIKGSYDMGDGMVGEISRMDDESKATLYQYLTNGRLKLQGSKRDGEDAKINLLYNQRF